MARFSLNSDKLFVQSNDGVTVSVWDVGSDLNSCNSEDRKPTHWKVVARLHSTQTAGYHKELEVWGTVLSGPELGRLASNLYDVQLLVNRQGYSAMYVSLDGSKQFRSGGSCVWKLNDIYHWGFLGVQPSITWLWDRYCLAHNGLRIGYRSEMDRLEKQVVEFAAWEPKVKEITSATDREIQRLKSSYEEKLKVKDGEIQRLKSTNVENMNTKNGEIRQLKSSYYEEKMMAKNSEIQKLSKSTANEEADGIVGELRMEMAELKLQLDDAWRENEELKVAAPKNG